MPKMKTNRGAAKRFKKTGTGGFKRGQSHLRHILTKKSSKRKRQLGSPAQVHEADVAWCVACCRLSEYIFEVVSHAKSKTWSHRSRPPQEGAG